MVQKINSQLTYFKMPSFKSMPFSIYGSLSISSIKKMNQEFKSEDFMHISGYKHQH